MRKHPYFLVTLLVVLLDQITKYFARSSIGSFQTIKILPFLQLVCVRNEGAAFGMFRSFGNATFIVISLAAMVFVLYLLMKSREDRLGLSLILGGAAGNLIDRLVFGNVTDFVDVFVGRFHWPAFNIADSALTVGIIILLLGALLHHRRESNIQCTRF
jgi:signal peptidase II